MSALGVAGGFVCLAPASLAAPGGYPVIGGDETSDFPAVVELEMPTGYCTGVVVGARAVLTVAHCIDDAIIAGTVSEAKALFGAHTSGEGALPDRAVPVLRGWYHPHFGKESYHFFDVGILELAEDAGVEPLSIDWTGNAVALGDSLWVVGYGYSTAQMEGAGKKRFAPLTVVELSPRYVGTEDPGRTPCDGDSGGPLLAGEMGGPLVIVAVHSIGTCIDRGHATRIAGYREFVSTVLGSIEGACAADGVCLPDGCTAPDPDCDACGLDGECGTDCEVRDWDCPGAGLGSLCETDGDCGSGVCTEGLDDPRIRYCTLPCTERFAEETCQGRTFCEPVNEQESVCKYTAPSPTAQGALCDGPEDCRSGICDLRFRICTEPCGDGGSCPDKFVCAEYEGEDVCTKDAPETGCSCSGTSGGPAGGAGPIVLGALLLACRRRHETGAVD